MVLGKRLALGGSTRLLAHLKNSICLPRTYAGKNMPSDTCATKHKKKLANAEKCDNTHPKPRDPKTIQKTFPFYHLVKLSKDCCEGPCPENDFAPFDKCFYKESDKNAREYQVTWAECPAVAIKPKKICCFEKTNRPPVHRRKNIDKPSTACKPQKCDSGSGVFECPKITIPGCKPLRKTVKCLKERFPSSCLKVKAPYPAFSECVHAKLRKRPNSECHCWDEIPTCEFNRQVLRGIYGKSPCKGGS